MMLIDDRPPDIDCAMFQQTAVACGEVHEHVIMTRRFLKRSLQLAFSGVASVSIQRAGKCVVSKRAGGTIT